MAGGRRVWSPEFACRRVRVKSLVRGRGDHRMSLRARTGDSALHRGPLPVASNDNRRWCMKQIRDKVGGLDVHRDNVVACTRVTMPDGSVEVAKERFSTTQSGLAELTAFLMDAGVEHRGDGGDGGLLADGLLRPRGPLRRAVALQRRPRKERTWAQKRISPMPSGWPMWRRTGWCGPPSCPRPISESCAS